MEAMAKSNPVVFFQQVLAEARKVSWATRSQTTTTAITVVVFVFLASIFFLAADFVARFGVGFLLGLGR
jgi:preprotein translocase subunit SecE